MTFLFARSISRCYLIITVKQCMSLRNNPNSFFFDFFCIRVLQLTLNTLIYLCVKVSVHFRIVQSIESLDKIHSCLLRILMWSYQSKVNYLCVKLRVHFRVFRKKCRQWFWQFLVGRLIRLPQSKLATIRSHTKRGFWTLLRTRTKFIQHQYL